MPSYYYQQGWYTSIWLMGLSTGAVLWLALSSESEHGGKTSIHKKIKALPLKLLYVCSKHTFIKLNKYTFQVGNFYQHL